MVWAFTWSQKPWSVGSESSRVAQAKRPAPFTENALGVRAGHIMRAAAPTCHDVTRYDPLWPYPGITRAPFAESALAYEGAVQQLCLTLI